MTITRLGLSVATVALGIGLTLTSAHAQERIVATVNGEGITEADLQFAEVEWGDHLGKLSPDLRRRAHIELLIESQLFARAATDENLLSKSKEIDLKRFSDRLALRNYYYQKRVKDRVTEEDVRNFFEDQVKTFRPQEEVRARHILVNSRELAIELAKQLSAGADFAALARHFSQDPTTNLLGGDLGYFVRGQMVSEIDEVAFSLKKGEVSESVKTQFGWHLVRVDDRRVRAAPTFDELKDYLATLLVQRRIREMAANLRAKAKIEIDPRELVGSAGAHEPSSMIGSGVSGPPAASRLNQNGK